MTSQGFIAGLIRIWRDDQIAIAITFGLIIIQILVFVAVWRRTGKGLKGARKTIEDLAHSATHNGHGALRARIQKEAYPRLQRAWATYMGRPQNDCPGADGLPPEEAFDASRLLPPDYNQRLDSAAPGLFTALGIIGTFVGLILGFLRVDPGKATESVGPLLGGMVVAFLNSLVGVLLSVYWSYRSRVSRHDFDNACDGFAAALATKYTQFGLGDQMLSQLRSLNVSGSKQQESLESLGNRIDTLTRTSKESSDQLLANLSTQVGDSVKSIVNAPFEQLNESVLRFDEIVKATSGRQEEMRERLELAARHLAEAESRLSASLSLAKECVDEFSTAALQLREGATNAEALVGQTHAAATELGRTVSEVSSATRRYEELGDALSAGVAAAREMVEGMSTTASRFENSSSHLEKAVSTIEAASDKAIEDSVEVVRRELDQAIRSLVDGIRDAGQATIGAYQQSSEVVVRAVDGRMADLTDRLSAELTTLANRLPAEVESLNQAMVQIRNQIQKATRSMDDAVNQLAHRTPEALSKQLDAYDKALAKAMDHFSGTLQQWDGKLSTIEALSGELRQFTTTVSQRPQMIPPVNMTPA